MGLSFKSIIRGRLLFLTQFYYMTDPCTGLPSVSRIIDKVTTHYLSWFDCSIRAEICLLLETPGSAGHFHSRFLFYFSGDL